MCSPACVVASDHQYRALGLGGHPVGHTAQEHAVFVAVGALGADHDQVCFLFLGKLHNHLRGPACLHKTAHLGSPVLLGKFLGMVDHFLGVIRQHLVRDVHVIRTANRQRGLEQAVVLV